MEKRIWITNWLYSVATVGYISVGLEMVSIYERGSCCSHHLSRSGLEILFFTYAIFSPLVYYLMYITVNWINSWFVDWFNAKVFTKYITEEVEVIKEVEVIREVPSQIVIKNMNVQDGVVMEE